MRAPASSHRRQRGFTLIELIIATCIIAILGSLAIAQVRDYGRRAKISEVMLAMSRCKNIIHESYLTLEGAPQAGRWGCEGSTQSQYAGVLQTAADGTIRVPVGNLDGLVNGRYIHLVPTRLDGVTGLTGADFGRGVSTWVCGSDWQPVRNSLPANCRRDTTTFASQEFQ